MRWDYIHIFFFGVPLEDKMCRETNPGMPLDPRPTLACSHIYRRWREDEMTLTPILQLFFGVVLWFPGFFRVKFTSSARVHWRKHGERPFFRMNSWGFPKHLHTQQGSTEHTLVALGASGYQPLKFWKSLLFGDHVVISKQGAKVSTYFCGYGSKLGTPY